MKVLTPVASMFVLIVKAEVETVVDVIVIVDVLFAARGDTIAERTGVPLERRPAMTASVKCMDSFFVLFLL